MSADKVVPIHGGFYHPPGEVNQHVVDVLERYAEMARSGEIDGVVLVVHHADGGTSSNRGGVITRNLIGMLEIEKSMLVRDQLDGG